jgi:intracellular sulfur oxidation DsrE/DsrF family protein
MKNILLIGLSYFYFLNTSFSQAMFPVITDFGGIYKIDASTVLPDSALDYNIVIDVHSGPQSPHQLNPALNNVARMLNLHAVGGVPAQNLKVVLAIHGDATVAVLDNESYIEEFEMANPNTLLIKALAEAGVKLTVCGQSLIGRDIDTENVSEQVEIATSMLTTVTTYQMKGYAFLRF